MSRIYDNITKATGNTPLVKIKKPEKGTRATILLKLEFFNPLSSVKDRIGAFMIEDAEKKGNLKKGSVIIEPTSGNTGIALAFAAAAKGYKIILTVPDSMSKERIKIMKALGAEVVLTDGKKGMKLALEEAEKIHKKTPGSFMPQQFKNPANPAIHEKTTAEEIWRDTGGKVDVFVSGVGTGGTITGVGRFLKKKNPGIKIIAVEPEESPVLSGGKPGPHKIQGIGAGFVPEILDRKVIDEIITTSYEEALKRARSLAREEGIFVGISTGANLSGAVKIASRKESAGKTIVTIACDSGERYLSTDLFGE